MADRELSPAEITALVAKHAAEARKLDHEGAWFAAQARREAALAEAAELELRGKRRSTELDEASRKHHRVYDFTSAVTASSAETCMQTLAAWGRQSPEPITISLNSPGGEVVSGLRLFDFIRTLTADGIEVTTVTLGYAASMGGILLQAGTRRVMGPNSWLLIHEVSASTGGKLGEMDDDVFFYKALNSRLQGILAERAKVTKVTIAARAKRKDWWISADDAVTKYGFADEIGYR